MHLMTEDCLYLNIYTKNLIKRNSYDYEVCTNQMLKVTQYTCIPYSGAAIRRQQAVQCQPAPEACHCVHHWP